MPAARRAFWLGLLSFLPLLVWWLGWTPGFVSPDTLDQLTQVETGQYTNFHPAIHSLMLALLGGGETLGAISLLQALALAGLLALLAKRMVELGVPTWLAVGAAWLVSLLPAVGPTVLAIWKDVPFSLGMLWIFAELLLLARLGDRFWTSRWPPLRLGLAAAVVWLFRHNGLLTVLPLLVALTYSYRRHLRRVGMSWATLLIVLVIVLGPLYALAGVDRTRAGIGELLVSDVAASFVHEPSNFSADETAFVESIAPRPLWVNLYDCDELQPLLFHPSFSISKLRLESTRFLILGFRTLLRDPDTVLGGRACLASYLFAPPQPTGAYLHRPPFDIPDNALGITRQPVSERAYRLTLAVWEWAEQPGWMWLTWRPGLPLIACLAVLLLLRWRARLGRLGWVLALVLLHVGNVAFTSLAPEFRFAFPLYLIAWMILPLASLARVDAPAIQRSP